MAAALNPASEGEVFNLGSEQVVSLKWLAEKLVALHGSGKFEVVPFPPDRKAIDIGDYYSNFSKIKTELGWQPTVGLRQGLAASLVFYGKHYRHYWDTA